MSGRMTPNEWRANKFGTRYMQSQNPKRKAEVLVRVPAKVFKSIAKFPRVAAKPFNAKKARAAAERAAIMKMFGM